MTRLPRHSASQVVSGILQLAQALRVQSWRSADAAGISPTQRDILTRLGASREPRRLAELAAALSITSATASDAVTSLEGKGLVHKRRSTDDGRALAIELTATGRRRAQAAEAWPGFLTGLVEDLPEVDQAALLRALSMLIKGLQEQARVPVATACVTCAHFRPNAHPADAKAPHHCACVDSAFGEGSLRLACSDHRPAAPEVLSKNWRRFRRAGPSVLVSDAARAASRT